MNDFSQYTFFSQVLAFVSLGFCLIAMVLSLNSLWRAHKMLATFIWLCVVSVAIFAARKIFGVLGYNQVPNWTALAQYFDIAQSFFFMLATIEFYRIIRVLDGETTRISGLNPGGEPKQKR
jgi:hypothetical protein